MAGDTMTGALAPQVFLAFDDFSGAGKHVLRFAELAGLTTTEPASSPLPPSLAHNVQVWHKAASKAETQRPHVSFIVVNTAAVAEAQLWTLADALVTALSDADVSILTILAALHLPYAKESSRDVPSVYHSALNVASTAAHDLQLNTTAFPPADAAWEIKDRFLSALLHLLKVEHSPCTHLLLAKGYKPGRDLSGTYEAADALGRALQLFTSDCVTVDQQEMQRALPRLLAKDKELGAGKEAANDHLTLLYH